MFVYKWSVISGVFLLFFFFFLFVKCVSPAPCLFVPSRRAHQPGLVLWAYPPAILARVVCRPGGLLLQGHHRGKRFSIQTTRSGTLLPHGHFPGQHATPLARWHAAGPAVARERPHRPLAVWLWHGHGVLWNWPAQVLTHTHTHTVHTVHTTHVGTPQEVAASRLYTTRPLPPRQRLCQLSSLTSTMPLPGQLCTCDAFVSHVTSVSLHFMSFIILNWRKDTYLFEWMRVDI